MFSPDDLSELLSDAGASRGDIVADGTLRDTVLARTTRVLRTRSRMKRIGAIAALAGCYLAGVLTMSVWRASAGQLPRDSASSGDLAAQVQPKSESQPTRPLIRPEDDGVITGASAQTTVAKLSPYDRLRRTGDRQLENENDIAAAARTYRRALKLASPIERDIIPDKDTWLLMAMKNQTDKLASEDLQ
jgi:hypothetical protein